MRAVCFCFLLFFSNLASAEWIGSNDGALVDHLQINHQGSVRIYIDAGTWTTQLCAGYPNPSNVLLDSNHKGFNAIYSAILSAKATEKRIRIYATRCIGNVPAVETIQLLN
ncbi:MAG: hypothetical protein AAF438_04990 [Pseudomonadota bacterium]